MMNFGWWTSGKDRAAIDLFDAAQKAMVDGVIQGRISYVFCSRARGEGSYSDRLFDMALSLGMPVAALSAVRFRPGMRVSDREQWRQMYHEAVLDAVKDFPQDIVVLAGYMWVVSPEVCRRLTVINLHPALPGGPCGTWQEVIWQLLDERSDETGVMMHLVTPILDRGQAITYCRFRIKGGKWAPLWRQLEDDLNKYGFDAVKAGGGGSQPLFDAIRAQGVKREIPLIIQTLRSLALRDIYIKGGALFDGSGHRLEAPFDMTKEIEAML
ncbi:MAG: formyltransferase family protein [Desulfobacteraceae bacterium]|nr:formyltransferase family protein [Desulfobacteraceae bacterium]